MASLGRGAAAVEVPGRVPEVEIATEENLGAAE
jgi:hypothetical protein